MNTISIVDSCKEGNSSSSFITDINIESIYNRNVATIYKICYLYSFIFTNVPKTDMEDTLDSIDMSIYVPK